MGLTSAMYTGLSGLSVNQTRIETVGHNIANVNTTGFRGSRTLFQTQFAHTLSAGTAPSDASGGTNPMQIGHGAMVAATQRTLTSGALETTGISSDLAIEGAGFFVLQDARGRTVYSRDGSFTLNSTNQLVNGDGYYVQGYSVDENFEIIPGVTGPMTLPVGNLSIARATETIVMDGDLSAAESVATTGSAHTTQALVGGGGAAATDATQLTDLRAGANPGVTLFAAGDTIRVNGITRGGRTVPPQQFVVGTTGNTLGDLAGWLQTTLGVQTEQGLPGTPGVTVENGTLVIRSNAGEPNAFEVRSADISSTNASAPMPFQWTETTEATGSGVFTSFTAYDSLGNPVNVNATFTLEQLPVTGPVWRYYLDTENQDGTIQTLGSGTVSFTNDGTFLAATGNEFSIDRSGTGATSPMSFVLDFSTVNGLSTLASNVVMADQDGFPPGTLLTFSVGQDGVVTGIFSNGLTRDLGQIALATFANETGLVAETDNMFIAGPNSGPAAVTAPGTLGAGLVRGGALEMSNVDLSAEFISLITSSTGFQASSRVITTSNELLDHLLMTLR